MSRTDAERIADVRRVLEAARRLRGHEALLERELAKATGLSVEGVRLGLREHLEVDATDEELGALVTRARAGLHEPPRVNLILSANVFVGALRALAFARACAREVVMRPSSREPFFARGLVHELADSSVTLDEELRVEAIANGEIHVYGRDETVASVRARACGGVIVRGHGTGLGVALVGAGDEVAAAADVARDVVPFDQRGCLSPRIALVLGDRARALRFAGAMSSALARWQDDVPRGELTDEERAESARYRGTMAFAGELFDGPEHAVGVAEGVTLPPPGRHVHVVPCATEADVVRAIAPHARYVAALGASEELGAALVTALAEIVPRARRSRLGRMQRPPLDGPVDLR
jgi:hypothetical protein